MRIECSYIIVLRYTIIIVEGWSSPQYRYLGPIARTLCWLIGLICFRRHIYKRDGIVDQHIYNNLKEKNIDRAIIQARRNPVDETNTYNLLYVSHINGCNSSMS
jgi:hypothetical protein